MRKFITFPQLATSGIPYLDRLVLRGTGDAYSKRTSSSSPSWRVCRVARLSSCWHREGAVGRPASPNLRHSQQAAPATGGRTLLRWTSAGQVEYDTAHAGDRPLTPAGRPGQCKSRAPPSSSRACFAGRTCCKCVLCRPDLLQESETVRRMAACFAGQTCCKCGRGAVKGRPTSTDAS
jgi:hypothetical protein